MKIIKSLKVIATLSAISLTIGAFAGCNSNTNNSNTNTPNPSVLSGKITINGSSSMEKIVAAFKKSYETKNTGIKIEAQTTDSSTGIKAAIDGTTLIGTSSRELKDSEKPGLTSTIVAYDGIAVVINKGNTLVKDLTKDQITKIYRGEIKNWKEVGGKDASIVVVVRETGSGTRDAFEEKIDKKGMQIVSTAAQQNSTGAVLNTVKGNENAIGYSSLGELTSDVVAIKVNGIEPSPTTVKNNTYLIKRPFIMISKSENALVKDFLKWAVSAEGQKVVTESKFINID